jgi:hypothetical protein
MGASTQSFAVHSSWKVLIWLIKTSKWKSWKKERKKRKSLLVKLNIKLSGLAVNLPVPIYFWEFLSSCFSYSIQSFYLFAVEDTRYSKLTHPGCSQKAINSIWWLHTTSHMTLMSHVLFIYLFKFYFIHMCIQCLAHFSPPLPHLPLTTRQSHDVLNSFSYCWILRSLDSFHY